MFIKCSKVIFLWFCMALLMLLCSCDRYSADHIDISVTPSVDIGRDSDEYQYALSLDDVMDIANRRREKIGRPDIDSIFAYIQRDTPGIIDLHVQSRDKAGATLSAEEAISDAKVLFDLLRYSYGGYWHFGGDEAFEYIFSDIIETLSKQDVWFPSTLAGVMQRSLSEVIADNHFSINNTVLGTQSYFFVWETPFDKDENGFRKRDTGFYVSGIQGHDIDSVFRLAMNEKGEFFYVPIIVRSSNQGGQYSLTIDFNNGDRETVSLSRHSSRQLINEATSLRFEENMPIVTLREMRHPDSSVLEDREDARSFLAIAETLKYEDIIIIDIRSNLGGHCNLTHIWLRLLTGDFVPNSFVRLTAIASFLELPEEMEELDRIYQTNFLTNPYKEIIESSILYTQPISIGNTHGIFDFPDMIFPNDQLIILLIDRNVSSAGENFTDQILCMENTLVIGQNTFGIMQTGGVGIVPFRLPNSGINVSMGKTYNIWDESYFEEGIGIAPDVWVIGDALGAALAMLRQP